MTEPWAAQLTITDRPRLTFEALHALRSTIDGALLSSSSSTMMRGICDVMERSAGRRQHFRTPTANTGQRRCHATHAAPSRLYENSRAKIAVF